MLYTDTYLQCLYPNLTLLFIFFLFTDPSTAEIYTLSLHDALPIWRREVLHVLQGLVPEPDEVEAHLVPLQELVVGEPLEAIGLDRKSTRLNSSHTVISYAVFCLKKKKKNET